MTPWADPASPRWSGLSSAARQAAVARVEPVARFDRAAPVDPARRGGFNEAVPTLPLAQPVLAADVARFQRVLSDVVALPGVDGPRAVGAMPTHAMPRSEAMREAPYRPSSSPQDELAWWSGATPADRIVATLQHLRSLRGL